MAVTAYVAIGSNLGKREDNLDQALSKLQENPSLAVSQVSTIYETEPVGGPPGQNDFLNAVAEVQSDLGPRELMDALLSIEKGMGRIRAEKDGPRNIDLDLLLYGDEVIHEEGLEVPHPRMHLRSFVLEPLAELAANVVHPKLGVTIGQLWDDFEAEEEEIPSVRPVKQKSDPAAPRSQSLLGLRALVTGSTSGIGRAIALAFASAGASVIIHGRRKDAAQRVADEVEALGMKSGLILSDIQDADQCRELIDSSWDEWGPFDIWVNNAGADTLTGEAADWPFEEKLYTLFEVDVMATMLIARGVGRRMKRRGDGVILNMGWDQAETGMEGDSGELFAATKGAVMAFSKSLAKSLAPEVRVNCLAPGWIRTKWGSDASGFWQERVIKETPLARWGTAEDVAAAACWLVSPAASFVTGQVVRINGGAVR